MLILIFLSTALAASVNVARKGTDCKIRYPPGLDGPDSDESSFVPSSTATPLVSMTAVSTPMWIRDFLTFSKPEPRVMALEAPVVPKSKPVRTKIINYGPMLANEGNLAPFTRHLVESSKEDYVEPEQTSQPPQKIELDVEEFIRYLVEYKGFTEEQLNFLRRPELDHGYDEIERELTQIKRSSAVQRHITIGGEDQVSGASPSGTSLAVFVWSFLLLMVS